MATTADNVEMQGIEFQIVNDSGEASKSLEQLGAALSALKVNAKDGISATSRAGSAISKLRATLDGIDTLGIYNKLKSVSDAVNQLSIKPSAKISPALPKNITALNAAVANIQTDKILQLGSALQEVAKSSGARVSVALPKNITSLNTALSNLDVGGISKLPVLAEALRPLGEIEKANLSATFIKNLKAVPEAVKEFENLDMEKFKKQMNDLADALKPFADEMGKISSGFSAFPGRIQRLITSTERYNGATQAAAKNTITWGSALKAISFASIYRGLVKFLSSAISKASELQEDMNLFSVSMGEYAQESYDYARTVSEIVGVDPAEWMRNQGVFNTIITGFGVAGDKAALMSKNLTQLGYDLASFYNIDFENAMQKVQSGISGELEPMRRLGYDLSVARLEQERLNLGIDKSVSSMTQAEKSQLRYYTMMTQVTQVQGDMARTLNSPSNQLRILRTQTSLAAREIGNVFIPALNAVLPVAISIAKAIRAVASAVANVFGVQIPSVDYSGISKAETSIGGMSDNLESAGENADKLKNKLAGFDELNVIQSQSGGGSGGGGGIGGGLLSDIDLPEYDFLKDAVSSNVDKMFAKIKPVVDWISGHLREIAVVAGTIGAAILGWSVANDFKRAISLLKGDIGAINGAVLGVASAAITVEVSYMLTNAGLAGAVNENWGKLIESGLTSALGSLITGRIVKSAFGAKAGIFAGATTLAITAATDIFAIYHDVKNGGFDMKSVAQGIWDVVKGAAAGGVIASAVGASAMLGIAAGGGLALTGVALAIAIGKINMASVKNDVKWGNVELAKEQVAKLVEEQLFSVDVKATVNVIDTTISNVESVKTSLSGQLETFSGDLTMLKLGVDADGSMRNMLESLTGGAADGTFTDSSILGQINSVLSESEKEIKLGFAILAPDSGVNISSLIDTSDSIIQSEVQSIGAELASLLAKGVSQGLTGKEKELAVKLSETLSNISRSAIEGQIASGFAAKINISLADVTRETFGNVLEQFGESKSQLAQSYRDLAIQTQTELGGLVAQLQEVYNFDPSAENKAALEAATAAYKDWADNINTYIDNTVFRATAQGVQQISEAAHSLYGGVSVDDFGFKSWLESTFYQAAFQQDSAENIVAYIEEAAMAAFKQSLGKEDFKTFTDVLSVTGEGAYSYLPPELKDWIAEAMREAKTDFGATIDTSVIDDVLSMLSPPISSGIFDSITDVSTGVDAGKTAGENIISGINQADFRSAGSSAFSKFASGFSGTIPFYALPGISSASAPKIRGYATGGYPQSGELFIAREGGSPELVGQIGGSAAIANNDQIVDGIASGVATANEEQNALLREQNDLLRKLLQKKFVADVSPSAELGRVMSRSASLYEKAYG